MSSAASYPENMEFSSRMAELGVLREENGLRSEVSLRQGELRRVTEKGFGEVRRRTNDRLWRSAVEEQRKAQQRNAALIEAVAVTDRHAEAAHRSTATTRVVFDNAKRVALATAHELEPQHDAKKRLVRLNEMRALELAEAEMTRRHVHADEKARRELELDEEVATKRRSVALKELELLRAATEREATRRASETHNTALRDQLERSATAVPEQVETAVRAAQSVKTKAALEAAHSEELRWRTTVAKQPDAQRIYDDPPQQEAAAAATTDFFSSHTRDSPRKNLATAASDAVSVSSDSTSDALDLILGGGTSPPPATEAEEPKSSMKPSLSSSDEEEEKDPLGDQIRRQASMLRQSRGSSRQETSEEEKHSRPTTSSSSSSEEENAKPAPLRRYIAGSLGDESVSESEDHPITTVPSFLLGGRFAPKKKQLDYSAFGTITSSTFDDDEFEDD